MRQVAVIIILSFLFAFIQNSNRNNKHYAEAVISLPNLNNHLLKIKLETEFNNIDGIFYSEASILSHTIIVKYDPSDLNKTDLEAILLKWGCSVSNINFQYFSQE